MSEKKNENNTTLPLPKKINKTTTKANKKPTTNTFL